MWGIILRKAGDIHESSEKLQLSLLYANKIPDTIVVINRKRELAYNYLAVTNYEQSLKNINDAIRLANQVRSYSDLAKLYSRKAEVFYFMENYHEALRLINKAVMYNHYLGHKDGKSDLIFKGRLLVLNGKMDSARYYMEKGKDTMLLRQYYNCMSLLKEKQGDYEAALEYSRLNYQELMKDAIEAENDKIARLDKQYNTARIEAENKALKIRQQQNLLTLLGLIIVVMVAALVVYVKLSHYRKKMLDTMQQQSESIDRLRQNESRLIEERIKASEMSAALSHNLDGKEQELKIAQSTLADFKKRLFFTNRIAKKIQDTINAVNKPRMKPQPLGDDEIGELIGAINDCYDNFADRLRARYPSLVRNDVYLCCLIKIGLDNPALCAMLDVSDNTLRKRKYRLKKDKIDPQQQYTTLEECVHSL